MVYFVVKDETGSGQAGERLVNYIAEHAYCITLAVSLGCVKTLIECPYSMTHATLPEQAKRAHGLVPGGIRLSVGLEDWHDIIADLSAGLEQV